jgi:hypothetical protein
LATGKQYRSLKQAEGAWYSKAQGGSSSQLASWQESGLLYLLVGPLKGKKNNEIQRKTAMK